MSQILSLLQGALAGGTSEDVSRTIGADPARTQPALAAAIPLLISALARNAQQPGGADALHAAIARDHDGSVLDDPARAAERPDAAGILGHLFGASQPQAQQAVAQAGGIDAAQAQKLLLFAAPLVMAALGRTQRQNGLNADGLAGFLGGERQQLAAAQPGLLGLAADLLDRNHDGSALDDVAGMASKLFGK